MTCRTRLFVIVFSIAGSGHRLWQLNVPYLYRVTARVTGEGSRAFDEQSTRCGFRDFRFQNGYFRLNGKRIYLRCSHIGNDCPIGLQLPHDPDVLRRTLLNVKVMPAVAVEVTLWGNDPGLEQWLTARGIRARRFTAEQTQREMILASGPAPAESRAFAVLAEHMARGSTVLFLTPETLRRGDHAAGWIPLAGKGTLQSIPHWLYVTDEWAKAHPFFEGLPCGGLLDHTFYREIIPDVAWTGQEPAGQCVAGAINAAWGYSSGTLLSVHPFGAGRFVLNSFLIRPKLGADPVAERLLRNLLRHASREVAQPLAPQPADFDQQLKALGYPYRDDDGRNDAATDGRRFVRGGSFQDRPPPT